MGIEEERPVLLAEDGIEVEVFRTVEHAGVSLGEVGFGRIGVNPDFGHARPHAGEESFAGAAPVAGVEGGLGLDELDLGVGKDNQRGVLTGEGAVEFEVALVGLGAVADAADSVDGAPLVAEYRGVGQEREAWVEGAVGGAVEGADELLGEPALQHERVVGERDVGPGVAHQKAHYLRVVVVGGVRRIDGRQHGGGVVVVGLGEVEQLAGAWGVERALPGGHVAAVDEVRALVEQGGLSDQLVAGF